MNWLIDLFTAQDSVAHIALLYSLVIAIGILLGKIKIGGISLGVTFVLFVGILAGHIGFTAPVATMNFASGFRTYTVRLHDRSAGRTGFR